MADFEANGTRSRAGVAAFLRDFADHLDGNSRASDDRRHGAIGETDNLDPIEGHERDDDRERADDRDHADERSRDDESTDDEEGAEPARLTLIVSGDSATLTVPETVEFDVQVDSSSSVLSRAVRRQVDLRLSWTVENPDEMDDGRIRIE